jgi:predicted alpha/beta hydrolase family esterase
MMKAIFLPGNGGGSTHDNWFPYVKTELEKVDIQVIAADFPDNYVCKASVWLPFIEQLGADKETILIGYSTGAIAAMRYAQDHKILGSVLVAAYYTDMGIELEKEAEYFDTPWEWEKIRRNQQFIIQFHSNNDPIISKDEARFVHEKLHSTYEELDKNGHFWENTFPELLDRVKEKVSYLKL